VQVSPCMYEQYLGVLHQHLVTRNTNVVQLEKPIVHPKVPKLGTNVTHLDTCWDTTAAQ